MGFSLKLDDVDDNDGGTVMTTSTMKNNDVYNVQRTTSPLTSIQWQKHINLVFRIVKPKQRYHTETDCFFSFFKILVLCTANCCYCWW